MIERQKRRPSLLLGKQISFLLVRRLFTHFPQLQHPSACRRCRKALSQSSPQALPLLAPRPPQFSSPPTSNDRQHFRSPARSQQVQAHPQPLQRHLQLQYPPLCHHRHASLRLHLLILQASFSMASQVRSQTCAQQHPSRQPSTDALEIHTG